MNSIVFDNFKIESGVPVESDGKNNLHEEIGSPAAITSSIMNVSGGQNVFNDVPYYSLCGWDYPYLYQYPNPPFGKFIDSVLGDDYLGTASFHLYMVDEYANIGMFTTGYGGYKSSPNTSTSAEKTWVEIVGQYLVVSGGYSDRFYYTTLDTNFLSNPWNSVAVSAGQLPTALLNFKNNLYVSMKLSSATGYEIKRYNSSLSYVGSLQIPTSRNLEVVISLFNHNDTYIGIVLRLRDGDYLMFWDGDINSGVLKKIKCPGIVLGATSVNGSVFLMVEMFNGFDIYVLNGDSWSLFYEYRKSSVTVFSKNRLYKKLNSVNNFLIIEGGDRVLFIDTLSKAVFNYGFWNFFSPSIGTGVHIRKAGDVNNPSKNFYVLTNLNAGGLVQGFYFGGQNPYGSTPRQTYFYKSNWIFVGKRIKLNKLSLHYTNPSNADKNLNVKIWYIDEKRGGEIQSKDYWFQSSTLPKSYKEFNLGIECTRFSVQIWTDLDTTVARILKRAILDYETLE